MEIGIDSFASAMYGSTSLSSVDAMEQLIDRIVLADEVGLDVFGPDGHFQDLIIDSPNVKGIKGLKCNTNFRLKHLGYINKDLVDKKAEIYRAIIPDKDRGAS
jgi:hypothetical protein